PVGKKTDNLVKIPQWIMEGDNSIKAEFLAAFLGGDGYEPKFQGRTVKPITVGISKREDLKANLIEYLKQIEQLFNDFGIKTKYRICPGYKSIRKDKTKTVEGRIWITNSTENIYKFLTEVGYRYCSYKKNTSKDVIRYLEWKKGLGKYVYKFRPTPHFKEWKENLKVGDSAYHYLTSIEKIEDPKYVYCLSTENRRFVANNIVVHNCDALTREAQQALRRTMENYTKTTRFILSCNWSSKIVDPIQSRCAVFKFKPLKQEDILEVIDKISKEEELVIDDKAKQALFEVSSGDCRRVENILQSCAALGKEIKEETIYTLASVAKPKEINEALKLALENKFMDARNKMLDIMLGYGLSGLDVIKQIQAEILNLEIDSSKKMVLIDKCGEIEFRMTEGSDEFIQLEALLSQVALVNIK
ncbi:MAG: LAGLIDADG family homing endonuclease, partial [Candidatus Woesearchaeota archaeon]|nr:LAGLIDADG family homing endonuclease [Candidatus Woesearchaeota archaeon]